MANKPTTRIVMEKGLYSDNPILVQVIGICSALAVTNLMMNSLIMGLALAFVTSLSSLTVSALRNATPKHIRMMVQVLIISAYVILVDIFLRAFMPDMSKALGPYVGLIITNCIIMGRAEAFAISNEPVISFVDGLASGFGYTIVLLAISFVREFLGFGSIFGIQILGEGFTNWTLMVMPPSAFFLLGLLMWWSSNQKLKRERKGMEPK